MNAPHKRSSIHPGSQPASDDALSRDRARSVGLLLCLAALVASGCTSSITQLQRARALERGHFEINAGTSLPISGKAVRAAIDAKDEIVKRVEQSEQGQTTLEEADARHIAETSAALLLFMPWPNTELSVRGGIGWGIDMGLRLTGPRRQLDAKWQALEAERHGLDLALSVAVASHSNPAPSVLDQVSDLAQSFRVFDFSRRDLTVSLLMSRDVGEYFSLWGGFAYSRSRIRIGNELIGEMAKIGIDASALTIDETMSQVGGQLGFRIGYKYVFLLVEFSLVRARFAPSILGEQIDLSGWILTPATALQITF